MIRAQRRRHLVAWMVLLPLTAAGLIVALAVRPERPVQEPPPGLPASPGASAR